MANGFPLIGAPIPRAPTIQRTPLAPIAGQEPFVPPVEIPQVDQDTGLDAFLGQLRNNPNAIASLLQFSGALLQPKGIGQTSAGVFGEALAGATQSFIDQSNKERQLATQEDRTKLLEREVSDRESVTPSQIELNRARAGQANRSPQPSAARIAANVDQFQKEAFGRYFGITDADRLEVEWAKFKATDGANIAENQRNAFWADVAKTMPQFFIEGAGVNLQPPPMTGLEPGGREAAPAPGQGQFEPLPQGLTKFGLQKFINENGIQALYERYGQAAVDEAVANFGVTIPNAK